MRSGARSRPEKRRHPYRREMPVLGRRCPHGGRRLAAATLHERTIEGAAMLSARNHAQAEHPPSRHLTGLHGTARCGLRHGAGALAARYEPRVRRGKRGEEQNQQEGCGMPTSAHIPNRAGGSFRALAVAPRACATDRGSPELPRNRRSACHPPRVGSVRRSTHRRRHCV